MVSVKNRGQPISSGHISTECSKLSPHFYSFDKYPDNCEHCFSGQVTYWLACSPKYFLPKEKALILEFVNFHDVTIPIMMNFKLAGKHPFPKNVIISQHKPGPAHSCVTQKHSLLTLHINFLRRHSYKLKAQALPLRLFLRESSFNN